MPCRCEKRFQADIVAIGASTGGPAALSTVVSALPDGLNVPVVIVQHMPAQFLHSLAQRMGRESGKPCVVASEGMPLHAGRIHIAPGDIHSEVARSRNGLVMRLVDGPKLHSCRPAVDRTFLSLGKLAPGVKTLAVVLTGMGSDGAEGAKAIAEAGGCVIVQDEASSIVWGMPGAVVRALMEAEQFPLSGIADAIMRHVR